MVNSLCQVAGTLLVLSKPLVASSSMGRIYCVSGPGSTQPDHSIHRPLRGKEEKGSSQKLKSGTPSPYVAPYHDELLVVDVESRRQTERNHES